MPAAAAVPKLPHGICSGCRKFIAGEMVQAMGRCYHPEHFVCTVCSRPIGTGQYFEQDSQQLCANCYHRHFSPPCDRCGQPIATQLLQALGKKWHPECFVCCSCQRPFPMGQFYERHGQPWCPTCFANPRASAVTPMMGMAPMAPMAPMAAAAPLCKGCGQAVSMGQALQALDALWHPDHFVCTVCRSPFSNGQFYELSGLPVCPNDYQRVQAGQVALPKR